MEEEKTSSLGTASVASNFFIEKLYRQYKNINDNAPLYINHPGRDADQTFVIDARGYLLSISDPVLPLGRNIFDLISTDDYKRVKIAILTSTSSVMTVIDAKYEFEGIRRNGTFHILKIDNGERFLCYLWRGEIITHDFNHLKVVNQEEEKELALT